MTKVKAPWTDEQVEAIRAWQGTECFHGLTCETHSDDLLDVDNAGLSCEKCSYSQDWVPWSLTERPTAYQGFASIMQSIDPDLFGPLLPRELNGGPKMTEVTQTPMTLFDVPDDAPETCWVEVTIGDEDAARDYLAQFCYDENMETPFRPVGSASREWHRCTNRIVPNGEVWEKCEPTDDGALEFWKVVVD